MTYVEALDDFRDWLKYKKYSVHTVARWHRLVRLHLDFFGSGEGQEEIGEITPNALFDFLLALLPRERSAARTAWRLFVEFLQGLPSELQPPLPPLHPVGKPGRPVTPVSRSDLLMFALVEAFGARPAWISDLRWRDVTLASTDTRWLIFRSAEMQREVSRAFILAVRAEGFPDTPVPAPTDPLFPEVPGSRRALSDQRVELAVSRTRRAIDEGLIRPWQSPITMAKTFV